LPKIVVKLGGSFLTRKSESDSFPIDIRLIEQAAPSFVFLDRLRRISAETGDLLSGQSLMLVHGAGPFGHALVDGYRSGIEVTPVDIHGSMLVLNRLVMKSLGETGIRSETVSPFDTVEHRGEFVTGELSSRMKDLERRGIVPVSHGDVVPSDSGGIDGYEVVSGDTIACDISLSWKARKIIMVTDMDGILDVDPREGTGKTIPQIGYEECVRMLRGRGRKGSDVTGGIAQKIISCERPIRAGIPLHIISGIRYGNLSAACAGEPVGTVVREG